MRYTLPGSARILVLLTLCLPSFITEAHAQIEDIDVILEGGVDDANLLLQRYLEPFGAGFGAGLNAGWTSGARPHKTLGFHFRVGASVARVPSADRLFTVTNDELTTLRLSAGSPEASPTVSGEDDVPVYRFETEERHPLTGEPIAEFEMPAGIGVPYVPAPEIQAGIGLIKDTAFMLRLVPRIDMGEYGSMGLWGVGVHHGLNQWIPAGGLLPIDLSVQLGLTRFGMDVPLNEEEEGQSGQESDQELTWDANAFTFNVLAGKSLPFLSAYAGLGFETSSSDVALRGTYEVQSELGSREVVDPINLSLDGANTLRALAGLRLRLALVTINAEYTLANYPSLNAGVGLSLR